MNTTYFLNQVMGNVFGTKNDPALPTEYYIGLATTSPTVAGANDGEPSFSGTGYARVRLSSLSEPENGIIRNNEAINFNESITNWGTVSHYTVYDAETGGNLLFYGQLSEARTIEANTILTIKAGELSIQLTNMTV